MNRANETSRIADQFLRWRSGIERTPTTRGLLSAGVSYRKVPGGLSDKDAMWFVEQELPWMNVRVKSRTFTSDSARLLVEWSDAVTNLANRTRIRLIIKRNKIVSVDEELID